MSSAIQAMGNDQTLRITSISGFTNVTNEILKDASHAERIRAIQVIDEDHAERVERPREEIEADVERLSRDLADVLDKIREQGKLESFKWVAYQQGAKKPRPSVFWNALWKNSATLASLELDFNPREVDQISPPNALMENLQTLKLWAGAAHGDDGTQLNQILHNAPQLKHLAIYLPGCDLENCRIKNMTWDYNFPKLETLLLSVYTDRTAEVAEFLARHPNVTTFTCGLDTDYDIEDQLIPDDALPNLRVLKFEFPCHEKCVEGLLSTAAARPIVHLSVIDPEEEMLTQIANISKSLRCLEIEGRIGDWRPEEPDSDSDLEDEEDKTSVKVEPRPPELIKKLLPLLTELQEFAIDLDTETTNKWENHIPIYPPPLDHNDLIFILECLPVSSKIRALRISDLLRGKEIADEFLEDLPGVPESLEYLRWDISGGQKILYRIERIDGKTKAVKHEPLRVSRGTDADWTEGRILDY